MVMVDKDPSKAAAIGTLLQAGGIFASAADNLVFPYSTDPGNQNPKYELIELVGGGHKYCSLPAIICWGYRYRGIMIPVFPCYFGPGADGVYRGLGNRGGCKGG